MMCGNEQAAPWYLKLTGNTTTATESEAATLKLPDVALDVFPTINPYLQEEAAWLPHNTFFPPFLDPAISSLACHPSIVHCPPQTILGKQGALQKLFGKILGMNFCSSNALLKLKNDALFIRWNLFCDFFMWFFM